MEAGEPFVTQATGRPGTGLKLNPEGALSRGRDRRGAGSFGPDQP